MKSTFLVDFFVGYGYLYMNKTIHMKKTVIINESMMQRLMTEQIITEGELSKTDVAKAVKDVFKNDRELNKDIEKKVKSLVAASVNLLFKTLWQRRNFYEDEIKK